MGLNGERVMESCGREREKGRKMRGRVLDEERERGGGR